MTHNTPTQLDGEIDNILVRFFNEAEKDVHSDNYNDGVVVTKAGTNAKQAVKDLLVKERIDERKKVSDAIRRQRDHYKHDKLFGYEYQDGMSDAAVIAYDADKWED